MSTTKETLGPKQLPHICETNKANKKAVKLSKNKGSYKELCKTMNNRKSASRSVTAIETAGSLEKFIKIKKT